MVYVNDELRNFLVGLVDLGQKIDFWEESMHIF